MLFLGSPHHAVTHVEFRRLCLQVYSQGGFADVNAVIFLSLWAKQYKLFLASYTDRF